MRLKHPKNDPFSPSGHGIDISDEDVVPRNTKADSHCVPQTISPPDFSSASSTLDFNPSKESRLRSNEYTNEPVKTARQIHVNSKPDLEIPPRPSASQIPTNSNPSKVENVTQPTSNSHWVIVSSILEEESPANLRFKVNDFLFWLDYDPGYISKGSLSLTPGKFLECLTWAGDSVVVPSACVRLPKSDYELAQGLSRQPRASALTDYTAKSREELSVKAGEVVYLFKKLDDDYYLVMNKSNMRGKLPKDILSVLLAPT
ncbi:hypothetical protein Aperf_G00000023189 [Anoplocephala perfoliata]